MRSSRSRKSRFANIFWFSAMAVAVVLAGTPTGSVAQDDPQPECGVDITCTDTTVGVALTCGGADQSCDFELSPECQPGDCQLEVDISCGATTCDYEIDSSVCDDCDLISADNCDSGCEAAFIDDCSTATCDVGLALSCDNGECSLESEPDCDDCIVGFDLNPPDLGPGTYYIKVEAPFAADPDNDYELALDTVGLGPESDAIAAASVDLGEGIRFADNTDPATNPVTRSDARPVLYTPIELTTCSGSDCTSLPTCDEVICSGAGVVPGHTYVGGVFEYNDLPDLSQGGSQLAVLLEIAGAETWIPISQFPGDGFGGSSDQIVLQGGAGSLELFRSTTAGRFVPEGFDGVAIIRGNTVVLLGDADVFANGEIVASGMSTHVHDGGQGATPSSESAFYTSPQWPPDGGPRTALEVYNPLRLAGRHVINSALLGQEIDTITGEVLHTGATDVDDDVDASQSDTVAAPEVVQETPDDSDSDGGSALPVAGGVVVAAAAVTTTYLYYRRRREGIGLRPRGERPGIGSARTIAVEPVMSVAPGDDEMEDWSFDSSSRDRSSSYSSSGGGGCIRFRYPDRARRPTRGTGRGDSGAVAWRRLAFNVRWLFGPYRARSGSPSLPEPMMISGGRLWRPGERLDGRYIFVLDRLGRFVVALARPADADRPIHTDLLPFGRAFGAGEFRVADGRLLRVSDASGHFRPGAAQMLRVLDRLASDGVELSDVEVSFRRRDPAAGGRRRGLIVGAADLFAQRGAIESVIDEAQRYSRHRPWRWDRERDRELRQILDQPLRLWGFPA